MEVKIPEVAHAPQTEYGQCVTGTGYIEWGHFRDGGKAFEEAWHLNSDLDLLGWPSPKER